MQKHLKMIVTTGLGDIADLWEHDQESLPYKVMSKLSQFMKLK